MHAIWFERIPQRPAKTLIVFLPGRSDKAVVFQKHGFVERMWEAGITADAVLADAHLGFYRDRVFGTRLREDIWETARARGYERIWAVGVSLGGFGAVMFEREFPGSWNGIVLLAPFPGDQKTVLNQIRGRDSLVGLDLPPADSEDDYTAGFWRWMQQHEGTGTPPVLMGYGAADRMRREQDVIAAILTPENVVARPGGHNWTVWIRVWEDLLPLLETTLLENPAGR